MWARRSRKQSCAILLFIDGGGGGWVSEAISTAGGFSPATFSSIAGLLN